MRIPGIFEIADFDFVPWGNAYFNGTSGDTTYCQEKNDPPACNSKNGRNDWLDKCGAAARQPSAKIGALQQRVQDERDERAADPTAAAEGCGVDLSDSDEADAAEYQRGGLFE